MAKSAPEPTFFDDLDTSASDPTDIVVWFSCGAASAVAAKITIDKYGKDRVRVVNIMIAEEDEDNRRFLLDVEAWLGLPVEDCFNPRYPSGSAVSVWDYRGFMSRPDGAPCTLELKKEARYLWERRNPVAYHVLGFTADEAKRYDDFVLSERDNVLPVLIEAGMSKADCYGYLKKAGIKLPRVYSMGLPNANCIGCVKASSATYWNLIRKKWPEIFRQRAMQSRRIGARLARVKGQRIFLDELDPKAKGRPLKNMDFECGVFCKEEAAQ